MGQSGRKNRPPSELIHARGEKKDCGYADHAAKERAETATRSGGRDRGIETIGDNLQ